MISVNKCSELSNDEINEQINKRYELINSMCGDLYPQILRDEIEQLKKIIK